MSKRKPKVQEPVAKPISEFTKQQIKDALEITHSEFFMQTIALLSHDPEFKDLNYVRTAVTTPDGGTYLVCILHVDGPKIDLEALGKAAEEKEKTDSVEAEAAKTP